MKEVKPYWKKSHNCYYVNLRGKPTRLDPDEKIAWSLYRKLAAQLDDEQSAAIELAKPTACIHDLLTEFLAWTEIHREPDTLAFYQKYLAGKGSFAAYVGPKMRVIDLKPYYLTRWLDQRYPKASTTTLAGAITAVKRAFGWAKKEGYINQSPIADVERPERKARGEDAYMMPDQWEKFVSHIKLTDSFYDFVTVMKETGCRPQEIRRVEARHLDRNDKCWIFPIEESKGKREKRIVHLQDNAFVICQRLALKYPQGPLFRNRDGRPWTNFSLNCRCDRLSEKIGFPVCPYSIRHTFATQSIINQVDVVTIAALMGHKDLKMLNRIYQHVQKNKPYLKEALRKAIQTPAVATVSAAASA